MSAYAHHGIEVVVCVCVMTVVLEDVTTLTDVAVLVEPGTVEVIVDPDAVEVTVAVPVNPGAVEVTVVVAVAPAPPTVVVLTDVVVIVVVAAPVTGCRVAGGTLSVANPVFGGCAESCELTTTSYAVAPTSVGRVAMLSGPVHTFVVLEYVIGTVATRPPGTLEFPNAPVVEL